jgi:hypothetical protein
MFIRDNEIVTEAHDYMTTFSGGHKQRTLTPGAIQQHIRLRAELRARQEDQKKTDASDLVRKLRAAKAEKARVEKEARQKEREARETAQRAKVEAGIREKVKSANPGIKPDEMEKVVARLLEEHFIEQTKQAEEIARRQHLAGWNKA